MSLSDSDRVYLSIGQVVDDLDLDTAYVQRITDVMDQTSSLRYFRLGGKLIASGRHILYALMTIAVQESHNATG